MLKVVLTVGSLSLLLLLVLAGARSCASPDAALAGEWMGSRPLAPNAALDPVLARNLAGMRLTLKRDGTFLLADGGMPPFGGTWVRDGERLRLDVTTILGRPIAAQPEDTRRAAGAYTARVARDGLILRDLDGAEIRLGRVPRRSSSE